MEEHLRVVVVIPNWNGSELLQACLCALDEQTFRGFRVLVVDNGSTDNSVLMVRETFPDVQVFQNDTNIGFAAAINQGIQNSREPLVATLNNDTRPESGWLNSLVERMDSDSKTGACASKMLFADQPSVINSAGIAIDHAGIAWDRLGGAADTPDINPVPVFGACAGAALYRRSMLDELGGFDTEYFVYLEDVDLAWRAQVAGWKAVYVPQARVQHHHSATAGEGSAFKDYMLGRNKVRLLLRNFPSRAPGKAAIAVLYDISSVVLALLHLNPHPLRGRLSALLSIRRILATRPSSVSPIWEVMEPVTLPWKVWQRYRHLRSRR